MLTLITVGVVGYLGYQAVKLATKAACPAAGPGLGLWAWLTKKSTRVC